jgi:hypothetical protein
MLLHLDSRDLIDAFKGKSISIDELRRCLVERDTKLVYSAETIQEIVTPGDLKESHRRLETLLTLPHGYIHGKQEIFRREFGSALAAFRDQRPFFRESIQPFASTWQAINAPFRVRVVDQLEDRMVRIVMSILKSEPDRFRNTQGRLDAYMRLVAYDRNNKLNLRRGSGEIFRDAVGRSMDLLGVHPVKSVATATFIDQFARLLRNSPWICPSWRLLGETYSEFAVNVTDGGQVGDEPDFAHIALAPYVDGMTLDHRMIGYVQSACRRLAEVDDRADYRPIVFRNLGVWLTSAPA